MLQLSTIRRGPQLIVEPPIGITRVRGFATESETNSEQGQEEHRAERQRGRKAPTMIDPGGNGRDGEPDDDHDGSYPPQRSLAPGDYGCRHGNGSRRQSRVGHSPPSADCSADLSSLRST